MEYALSLDGMEHKQVDIPPAADNDVSVSALPYFSLA